VLRGILSSKKDGGNQKFVAGHLDLKRPGKRRKKRTKGEKKIRMSWMEKEMPPRWYQRTSGEGGRRGVLEWRDESLKGDLGVRTEGTEEKEGDLKKRMAHPRKESLMIPPVHPKSEKDRDHVKRNEGITESKRKSQHRLPRALLKPAEIVNDVNRVLAKVASQGNPYRRSHDSKDSQEKRDWPSWARRENSRVVKRVEGACPGRFHTWGKHSAMHPFAEKETRKKGGGNEGKPRWVALDARIQRAKSILGNRT